MKIAILIPSEDYRANAGARIRYGRIAPELEKAGHELTLIDIANFNPLLADYDSLIVSKCHDVRAILSAVALARRGCAVGVDLFDDYFSQIEDSRMTRYRSWLSELAPVLSFALCSTPAMSEVVRRYRPDLPVHVMNDPTAPVDDAVLAQALARKIRDARQHRTIDLCWFGIGDNPHFRVGLSDLAAFGTRIAASLGAGMALRLTVATNLRAASADSLAALRDLPLPAQLVEWSEEREAELLNRATAAFLPINAQAFSAAKSLNRAITALRAGCQVVSNGYPLYAPLAPLVYRDLESMIRDIVSGDPIFRPATIDVYRDLVARYASPEREANGLGTFLASRVADGEAMPKARLGQWRTAIVHGSVTTGTVHKFGQSIDALAIRSPFCRAKLGYDVLFGGAVPGIDLNMFISARAMSRVLPDRREQFQSIGRLNDQEFFAPNAASAPTSDNWIDLPLGAQFAVYAATMRRIREQIAAAFGPTEIVVSELSSQPFVTASA
jgi:hypothetical protein